MTKLAPIDKELEIAYARHDSKRKIKPRPIYNMPTDRSSSIGNRSTTSCKKKTLKQSVIESQWDIDSRRGSKRNILDSTYSRGRRAQTQLGSTARSVKGASTTRHRTIKTEPAEWKFNVGVMTKAKSNRNSFSIGVGKLIKPNSQKSSNRSVVSSIWSKNIGQNRGGIVQFHK